MNRSRFLISIAIAVAVAAGCEPSAPPIGTPVATTAPPSAAASGAAASGAAGSTAAATTAPAPAGSPSVEISGTTVTVRGRGDKNTGIFPLAGNYLFKSGECALTKVIPFVWVYDEFGAGRGTFVDAEFNLKNLTGNFYIRVVGPPTCDWTVVLTKE